MNSCEGRHWIVNKAREKKLWAGISSDDSNRGSSNVNVFVLYLYDLEYEKLVQNRFYCTAVCTDP